MIRQKQNFVSANWIAPVDSIRNVFWLIGSSFVSGEESLVNEPGNCGEIIAVVYELTKRTLEKLEMVRWESVPRGFSACAWKLSSRLFSRPDWLPLGLRGCILDIASPCALKRQVKTYLFRLLLLSFNSIWFDSFSFYFVYVFLSAFFTFYRFYLS